MECLTGFDAIFVDHPTSSVLACQLEDLFGQVYADGCAKFHIGGRQGIVLRTMLFHGLALAAVGFFERHRGTVMPRRGRVHRLQKARPGSRT
ncbi:hypothetical protein D3C85_1652290 [compost metagenome]